MVKVKIFLPQTDKTKTQIPFEAHKNVCWKYSTVSTKEIYVTHHKMIGEETTRTVNSKYRLWELNLWFGTG